MANINYNTIMKFWGRKNSIETPSVDPKDVIYEQIAGLRRAQKTIIDQAKIELEGLNTKDTTSA
jgi:hypothetical protein